MSVLKINCDECKTRHVIPDKDADDYCIYWIPCNKSPLGMKPKLLCPKCLIKLNEEKAQKEAVLQI